MSTRISKNVVEIRTSRCHECYLCGAQGSELYAGLSDRIFSVPGLWNFKRCSNTLCGLIWLDPMPLQEDIALAYQFYYTHNSKLDTDLFTLVYRSLRGAVLGTMGFSGIRTRYLGKQTPGKLLEIGCGTGDYLALMRTLGWTVEGVEIDPVACQRARQIYDLDVYEGEVVSKDYSMNSIDAIVMNHVIEHVFDPVRLLKECYRITKPGGRVIVITPNAVSWGHNKFQMNWRGLEPPRHIHLFSQNTMKKCAELAGFTKVIATTTPANAEYFFRDSLDIYRYNNQNVGINHKNSRRTEIMRKGIRNLRALLQQINEFRQWKRDASVGEEVVMICHK